MKRFASILTTLVLVLAIFTTPAHAMPKKFRGCPSVQQNGITYMLYKNCAIVRRTPNRHTVVIPNKIKANSKIYCVRSVWDHTFEMTPNLRKVDLRATDLEAIEDPAIFTNHKIMVIAHNVSTYKWLKRGHVNVTLKR